MLITQTEEIMEFSEKSLINISPILSTPSFSTDKEFDLKKVRFWEFQPFKERLFGVQVHSCQTEIEFSVLIFAVMLSLFRCLFVCFSFQKVYYLGIVNIITPFKDYARYTLIYRFGFPVLSRRGRSEISVNSQRRKYFTF